MGEVGSALDYLGPYLITEVLTKWKRVRVRKKRYDEGSRDKSDITLKWPQTKESRQLLEAEKAGKQQLQRKPVLTTP